MQQGKSTIIKIAPRIEKHNPYQNLISLTNVNLYRLPTSLLSTLYYKSRFLKGKARRKNKKLLISVLKDRLGFNINAYLPSIKIPFVPDKTQKVITRQIYKTMQNKLKGWTKSSINKQRQQRSNKPIRRCRVYIPSQIQRSFLKRLKINTMAIPTIENVLSNHRHFSKTFNHYKKPI